MMQHTNHSFQITDSENICELHSMTSENKN